ncbi:Xaa-Pro dipeptidyl-peptidase [Phytohabitans rumicis]|uniref:Xaa-Pro dipeptidyl-peptidase n=2 Tax=Phytohabitans rumicis TaxID=1076125 RepID=A0A6V8L724_9ACTN|nr:Xaa-Pro dipeptidyl-peptidase [Phytohabitans rumicis]
MGAALAGMIVTLASPAAASAAPRVVVRDGVTQPVFDYTQAIRERVFIETTVDSDGDGRRDRVEARIIRPRETEQGLRVPTIFQPSPYYAGILDVPNHDDIDRDDAGAATRWAAARSVEEEIFFGGFLDNYFVPRGYAVVFADSLGSGGSDGCPTSGGENETLGMKAVVDWLTGRARATDVDGRPAAARWSSGRVGMTGTSYNGTLPNAVAATGVRGLETIVPIAAISSWYDYYRANGGVVAPGGFQGEDTDILAKAVLTRQRPEQCADVIAALERDQDRETGDYSRFWQERDYLRDAGKVRASVLLVHGLNDWNVKTQHFGQWWDALAARGVPRKIWLHQGPHTSPFSVRRAEWVATLHRWFDSWLHRVDNGIMAEPVADVEVAPNQWRTYRNWPVPGTRATTLRLGPLAVAGQGTSFVDAPSRTAEDLVAGEQAADPNRLAFLTAPLDRPLHLSGTPRLDVRASLDGRSPYLTALLVDYGTADRATGLAPGEGQDCVGPSIPGDPGCFNRVRYTVESTPWKIVSRGWLDVRNRKSIWRTDPITPGKAYSFSWGMQPQDHVFAAGHRIGIVLISTDRDYTLRYRAGTQVTVDLRASRVTLPLASAG